MSGVDRISDLPDQLLIHMLSFLSTIEAVQTCVLSKRWSKLWQYVPSLHFDDEEFFSGIDNGLQDFLRFQLFVNSVLLLHGVSKLDKIYVRSAILFPHNASAVRMWVNHAIRCNPRAFDFVYYGIRNLRMPQTVFTCASLEDLGFWTDSEEDKEVIMPKYINLPRLKNFWLGGVAVAESFIRALVSACPSLEDLKMFECFADSLDICSQKLKSLIINDCIVMNTLLVSTPNLNYLCIYFKKETIMGGVRLENMQSLYEAEFCFGSEIGIADIPREFLFLSKISNATHLKLAGSDVILKALVEKELPNCSTFHNLTHLDISGLCFFDDFDVISRFFRLLPNLESLALWAKANRNAMEIGSVDSSRGTLASKCLKTIEIRYPKDTDAQELKMLLLASIEHPERVKIILSN